MSDAAHEEYLAVKELARFWGVCPQTIYRMLWAGQLPSARRVRGAWRIPRSRPPRPVASVDTFRHD